MTVASLVRVVVRTPAVLAKNLRDDTALVVSSEPWSITLSTSSGPGGAARARPPAGAPAVGHGHLAAGKRDLVAGDRDRLEDRAADHPLGLLVEIGEVVDRRAHSAASRSASAPSRSANSSRIRRTSPSSAWKST